MLPVPPSDGSRRERYGGTSGWERFAPLLGRAVVALGSPQTDRAREPETPRPEASMPLYLKHRGVRASGLRPLRRHWLQWFFDIARRAGEAHSLARSPASRNLFANLSKQKSRLAGHQATTSKHPNVDPSLGIKTTWQDNLLTIKTQKNRAGIVKLNYSRAKFSALPLRQRRSIAMRGYRNGYF